MNNKMIIGQQGELAVAKYLQQQGFSILAANYRQRCGEIDLIGAKNEVICFVEIKTRTTEHFALSQVVTPSKQRKIIKTAKWFIAKNKISNKVFRFDVAIVIGSDPNLEIRYLPNAFVNNARHPY